MSRYTVVPLILRLALAAIFIFHGLEKVGGEGNELGAAWGKFEGAPSKPVQLIVAWSELIGGIALAIGFLTRLAALGITGLMVGAIVTVTGKNGFSVLKGGYEYNLLIIAAALSLVLMGGGPIAVDRFVSLRRRQPQPH